MKPNPVVMRTLARCFKDTMIPKEKARELKTEEQKIKYANEKGVDVIIIDQILNAKYEKHGGMRNDIDQLCYQTNLKV